MKYDYIALPDELPEKLTGWTQNFAMHLNCGGAGHISTYTIKDDKGREMPMILQHHSKDKSMNGLILPGVKPVMSWRELREIWPIWIERARQKQKAAQSGTTTDSDNSSSSVL